MTSVLLTQMLSYTLSSTNAFSQYGNQQFTINNASIRLGKDIEKAIAVEAEVCLGGNEYQRVKLSFESESERSWELIDGGLCLNGNQVIDGLASGSRFIYTNDCLTVVLVPASNTGKNNINIAKPVVSQYDIKYKK